MKEREKCFDDLKRCIGCWKDWGGVLVTSDMNWVRDKALKTFTGKFGAPGTNDNGRKLIT